MTIQIVAIILGVVLLLVGVKIFFSPRNGLVKGPCKRLWDEAVAAGERYEKIRKAVVDLMNERNKLKEEIEELETRKLECEREYQKLKDEFNSGGVRPPSENDEAWWEERRRLREVLRAKEEECSRLGEELDRKRQRLKEVEEELIQGRILEELSRETYPEAVRKYWECVERHSGIEEKPVGGNGEKPCCPSGLWIGLVGKEGGELAVAGLESGIVYLMCLDNLDVTATLKWRGIRIGPGLGGGAGVELIFVKGPQYPCKVEKQVASVLGGIGFDLSAGPSISDYLEGLLRAGNQIPRALEGASGAQTKFNALKDFLKGSGSAVKDGLLQRGAAGGSSAVTAGFSGFTFPLGGIGINIGLWWVIPETCELISWEGCKECD